MTRFSPVAVTAALAEFRSGRTIEAAARAADVSLRTMHYWLRRDGEPYTTFQREVAKAQAAYVTDQRVAILKRHGRRAA